MGPSDYKAAAWVIAMALVVGIELANTSRAARIIAGCLSIILFVIACRAVKRCGDDPGV